MADVIKLSAHNGLYDQNIRFDLSSTLVLCVCGVILAIHRKQFAPMATLSLDDFDRQLVAALALNARLSNLELARSIPLSHSAISRRIKRLEDGGVLTGYRALVNRAAMGLGVRAFAGLARDNGTSLDDICATLKNLDEVASCWIVTGDHDIMIEVLARDLDHFADIMLRKVQKVPGIAATRSTFVMTEIKQR